MAKRICLLTDHHICTNPRLWKEAISLSQAGFEVKIISIFTSAAKRVLDNNILKDHKVELVAALNLIPSECAWFRRFYFRLLSKLAREVKLKFGIDTSFVLGYGQRAIKKKAIEINADLYIAHIDLCLYVGTRLCKKGKKVAFDMEDWYSRDYLVPERPVALLKALEKFAIESGVYCSCPSQAMAVALKKAYPNGKKVQVLYNGFSEKENLKEVAEINYMPSLVWFSQTIGTGRGLETILKAMEQLQTKVELHLIGDCVTGYELELRKLFPFEKGHQLVIHPPVLHHELVSILAKHSIGLAIENTFPESRDLTITNKILQYIQSGIKVMATDTAGQKEVAAYFKDTVALVPVDRPDIWAIQIEDLLQSPPVNRQEQLLQFNRLFSWEVQEKKLLELVDKAIHE